MKRYFLFLVSAGITLHMNTTWASPPSIQPESPAMMHSITPKESAPIPGISAGMVLEGKRLLLLSGQVPLRADGTLAGTTLETQMSQVMKNLHATLDAAGADFSHVARLTIYVRDYHPGHLDTIRTIRDKWINLQRPPASTLIGVAALAQPEFLIEIDAIALLPEQNAVPDRPVAK